MRTHTANFKTNIKSLGREPSILITYGVNTLDNEDINSATYNFKGAILKSVMRQLELDSNVEIPQDTEINFQYGIMVNSSYEYLDFGNFIVNKVEKQEDTASYKITCYDKLIYSMVNYDDLGIIYPITIRDYIDAICTRLGLTFANSSDTFTNYDKEIPNELYLDENGKDLGYTFRDVLDELAEVTASTICINENDELEIRYITDTSDTINEEFLKNVNVDFGEQYGPINTVILSRSAGADKISLSNPANLSDDDKIAVEIADNQIMNGNDRDNYLSEILTALYGTTYYLNDFKSTGICYYDLCDKYSVSVDNTTYSCVMLNDEINITQGLEENVYTEMPEQAETDYKKTSTTDRKINRATLIVNKQQGEIEALVSKTEQLETDEGNNYQELLSKFDNYTPTTDFVTLETSVTQLQTDTYTKTEINQKLVDGSVEKVQTISGTFDENGMRYEKTGAMTSTIINEIGVEVDNTTTNSELLFAGYDANTNETIVRTDNLTVRHYLVAGDNSRIEDYGNGGGMFIL